MSTTIDQRVVEMRFDNQHFEKNVQTSLSTLDKLKQSLNLTGASKGLESINHAAKNNNIGALGSAAEVVGAKFSALQVAGVTAIANITNSAVNAGKRMVKALTIDPVKTGFSEYELKMGSIQTIMASTGESLDVVNGYLNELNEYSDKTIYSFSDMTQNIGKFTNAGVKLKDAVDAIQGVSNVAAVSGANANEASRAMYNFAQALSAGYVKLIDWKSIENANMATVEFKNELIKSAVAAGTLAKTSDGMYKVLTENNMGSTMDQTISATKNFNDSLNYQWMTTEVLVNTLRNYSDETTEIGKKATKAATEVKTFSQMMDSLKESAQSGWAQTWEVVFGDFYEGKELWTNIYNVVSGIIDKMSDLRNAFLRKTLGSSWEKLAKKIEDAGLSVEKFTDLIYDELKKSGVSVEELEEKYGSLGNALKKGAVPVKTITTAFKKLFGVEEEGVEAAKKVTTSIEDLDAVVKKVIRGEFGSGEKRIKALTEAGYDYATVQNKVNELLDSSVRHSTNLSETNKQLSDSQLKQVETLSKLSDAQLKEKGYTDKQIAALRELEAAAAGSETSISELLATMEQKSGRQLLLESFQNLGQVIQDFFKIVKESWADVFREDVGDEASDSVYNLIQKLHELTSSMEISEDVGANLKSILTGIFSGFDLSWSLATASLMSGLKILNEVLKLFGTDLLGVLGKIGDYITQLNQWVENSTIFGSNTKFKDLAAIIVAVITGVHDCIKAFLELEIIGDIVDSIFQALLSIFGLVDEGMNSFKLENIIKGINDFFGTIKTWIESLDNSENLGRSIVNGLLKAFEYGLNTIGNVVSSFLSKIKGIINEHFKIELEIDTTKLHELINTLRNTFSKVTSWIGGLTESKNLGHDIVAGLANGIVNAVPIVINAITTLAGVLIDTFCSLLGIQSPSVIFMTLGSFIIAGLINGIQNGFPKLDGLFDSIIEKVKGIYDKLSPPIKDFATQVIALLKKVDFGSVISVLIGLTTMSFFKNIANAADKLGDSLTVLAAPIKTLAGAFTSISRAIDGFSINLTNLQNSFSKKLKAEAFKSLAVAILILVGAVAALTYLIRLDPGAVKQSIAAIALLAGIMWVLSKTLDKINLKDTVSFAGFAAAMIGISAAVLILAGALKVMEGIDPTKLSQIFSLLAGTVLSIAFILAVIGKVGSAIDLSSVGKLGMAMIGISAALILMAFAAKIIGGMDPGALTRASKAILGFVGIVALLSIMASLPINNVGKMMKQLSWSLLLLVGAAKIIAGMSWGEMGKAAVGILGLVGIISLLMLIAMIPKQLFVSVGTNMLAISGAMIALALATKIMGDMEWSKMGKAAVGLLALSLVVAVLVKITQMAGQDSGKIAATLLALSVSIGILAAVAMILGLVKLENLAKGIGAVSMLMAMIALIVKASNGAADAKNTMFGIAAAIGVMAIAVAALTFLDDNELKLATGALVTLMLAFAAIAKSANGLNAKVIGTLLIITAAVAALAYIIHELNGISAESALASAGSISLLLLAMSGAMHILNFKLNADWKTFGALVVLTAIVGALAFIIKSVGELPVASTLATAVALSVLLIALSESINILSTVVFISNSALKAVAVMTIVCAALGGILWALQGLPVQSTIANAISLSTLLLALSGAVAILSFIGPSAMFIDAALVALGKLVAGLAVVCAGLGALALIPGFNEFLSGGVETLTIIGSALGGFIGGIIGGIGAGIIDSVGTSLESLGTHLSNFMSNMSGFLNGIDRIDDDTLTSVTNLVKMMALITGASFLDKINNLFGEGSMESFATSLKSFGTAIVNFSDTVKGKVDEEAVAAAATAGTLMAELQNKVAPGLGVITLFTGTQSLTTFGNQLINFGLAIVGFSNVIKNNGGIDMESVNAAKAAGDLMVELQNKVAPGWSIVGLFTGTQSLTTFGDQLYNFGLSVVRFSNAVKSNGGIDQAAVEAAAAAGTIMAELQSKIPNAGGVFSIFTGNQDLATFGDNITLFGLAIAGFSNNVSGVDKSAVEAAANAGSILAKLQENLPEDKRFDGKSGLGDFGKEVESFGSHMSSFSYNIKGFDADVVNAALTGAERVKKFITSLEGFDGSGVDGFKSAVNSLSNINFSNMFEGSSNLSKVGSSMISSLTSGMKSKNGTLTTTVSSISKTITKSFDSKTKEFKTIGIDFITKLTTGMSSKATTIKTTSSKMVSSMLTNIRTYYDNFKSAGEYLVKGFAAGISANQYLAKAKAKAMAEAAIKAAREALQINSPSKVFREIGSGVPEGFAQGIGLLGNMVNGSVHTMADNAIEGTRSAMARIADAVNADIDTQPTIRPVLDLSNVTAGANSISGMFGMRPSVGLLANVNGVSAMMSGYGQNGNDDVVSAIDKLRKAMGNNGGNTYNINGITYDNGSELATAMETIVRHARIERRR